MQDLPVLSEYAWSGYPRVSARQNCIVAKQLLVSMISTLGATCDDILVFVENEAVERMGWEGGTDHCNRCLSFINILHVPHNFC